MSTAMETALGTLFSPPLCPSPRTRNQQPFHGILSYLILHVYYTLCRYPPAT